MPAIDADVIDTLVGIKPGSALDAVRNRRPVARNQAQASYRALFAPENPGGLALTERFAVAAFVTGLTGEPDTAAFYAAGPLQAASPGAGRTRARTRRAGPLRSAPIRRGAGCSAR